MRQREFKVGTLAEFWPEDQTLLGLNCDQGQTIFLRLRLAHDEQQFLHMDEMVSNMLHELCHNIHFHHTKYFWQLFYLIQVDHINFYRNGYTGDAAGHNPEGGTSTEQEEREKYGDNPAGSQGTLADNNPTSDPVQSNDGSWLCETCSLVNLKDHLCCIACGIDRDGDVEMTEG